MSEKLAKAKAKKIAKVHFIADMIDACREAGRDPVSEFWAALDCIDDPSKKATLLIELFDFIYPKKKQIEHTVDMQIQNAQLSHDEIRSILANDPFAKAIEVKPSGDS